MNIKVNRIIGNQSVQWKGLVECEKCNGINDQEDCPACNGEGAVILDCEVIFDIDPGTPPTIGGPPEMCDPGEGPYVTKMVVFHNDVDVTHLVSDIEAVDDYIVNEWLARN